ncbi:hypothetical protein EVA_14443, partial [gut metagenome]
LQMAEETVWNGQGTAEWPCFAEVTPVCRNAGA